VTEPLLEIQDLHASVAGNEILRGVDLTVRPGEVHALMGPNGSGKSTLALSISGMTRITGGEIRFEGKSLAGLSPEQIVGRLGREFPDDPEMRVSAETIYRSLFVQARGTLRHELTRYLRSQRTRRIPHQRNTVPGIHDMVRISERPAEVADRAVPGHWEGDLLLGTRGRSAIGTLVERRTRYVLLLELPDGRGAEAVRVALTRRIRTLPTHLRRSLTWDRGREMAEHVRFSVDSGVDVYFCDPHSPWQRGSNENTNGLLRQYFPKNFDLTNTTQRKLDAVARQLNGRPRRTLDWRTPAEAFAEVVR